MSKPPWKPDTWMPLYIAKYLADTQHLDRDQHGAYMLLLMSMWMKGGRLPDNNDGFANITKSTRQEWRRLRPVMEPFFVIEDGYWSQGKLAKEYDNAVAVSTVRKLAGARGGQQRAANRAVDKQANAPPNAVANAKQLHQQNPTQEHIHLNRTVATPTGEGETPVPVDNPDGDKSPGTSKPAPGPAKTGRQTSIEERGRRLGLTARPGESWDDFAARVEQQGASH